MTWSPLTGRRGEQLELVGLAPGLALDRAGSDADDPLEGASECRLGAVAERAGELGDRRPVLAQGLGRDLHPPAGQVLDDRLADELGEPRGERRARHRELAGELRDRPCPGRVGVDERERGADLRIAEGAEPAGLGRVGGPDPGADRLDDEDVGEPGDHGLAARPRVTRLGGDQPQRALHRFVLGSAGLDPDHVGKRRDEVARGGVVEADGAADEPSLRPAAAVAQDLVALGDLLAIDLEDAGRRRPGLASQPVAGAVGDQRHLATPEHEPVAGLELELEAARGDDVEPEVRGKRRQRHPPRGGELGAAVEGAAHPQALERVAERIDRGRGLVEVHGTSRSHDHAKSKCCGRWSMN